MRLTIFIPKEASNAIQGVSIPRPPSIKGDVYKARALLKGFNNACLVFVELGVNQRANCGIRDVGVRDFDRRVQILKDISQSLVLNNTEGLIRIDYPFD